MKMDVLSQCHLIRSQARRTRLVVAALIAISACWVSLQADPAMGNTLLTRVSQGVALRYWLANPTQAPVPLQERLRGLKAAVSQGIRPPAAESVDGLESFNQDVDGLPQNEESVTLCHGHAGIVLGGTNDYRGLLDPQGNLTGWHLSMDDGASVANEGLLPTVEIAGQPVPSGGDPVVKADGACTLFAASLNYDPVAQFERPNGIGVYRSDPTTLTTCPGGADPSCWPNRRAVATAEPPHFLDKEWLDVGDTGDGVHVWVVYTDFLNDANAPVGFTSASIMAVRCSHDLSSCTAPILISGADQDVQFGDVTIGPDQRTYITWSEIQGELEQTPQTFIHKLRIAPAGSTSFGPTWVVATEPLAIPFGGRLHANDFRIATYPKNEVTMVADHPRIFVVWDACFARPLPTVCEEPRIKLTFSDDDGETWSAQTILSEGGDNYFPTIAAERGGGLAVAWYTNRFDALFHSQQDVELVWLTPFSLETLTRVRVTPVSNETQADPLLGGSFIGDYIEVATRQGTAYVHYNANYRQVPLLGRGIAIPQQDNFLTQVPASAAGVGHREDNPSLGRTRSADR